MSVTTPETFKLSGGSCAANATGIIAGLLQEGLVGTNASGVITITNSGLTGANGARMFEMLVRIANANQAKLTYVAAA